MDAGELRDALIQMLLARDAATAHAGANLLKRIDKLAEKLVRRVESGNRTADVTTATRALTAKYERAAIPAGADTSKREQPITRPANT